MKLKKIASIAEIISAAAVIVSLLYVGYEVRQNTVAVQSSAYQAIHDAEDLFWSSISNDMNTSDLWETGLTGGLDALRPDQRPQFVALSRRLIYLFQNVHYQRRKAVLDDELWNAWLASLNEFSTQKGFQQVLEMTKPHLSDPFNALLNQHNPGVSH